MAPLTQKSTVDSSLVNIESISTIPTKEAQQHPDVDIVESCATETVEPSNANTLKKEISTRAFCILAISGSIGAGLLVASGTALERGGPGGVISAFGIVGVMVWCVMLALSELSASFPVQGSFYDYSVRFISESWGFAMGWNYVVNFALIVAFEITVVSALVQYWVPAGKGAVGSGAIAVVPASMGLLAGIQAFGAKGYGEVERGFGILKVLVLSIFVVTGIVITSGGTEEASSRGLEGWRGGAAFSHGFNGFLSCFVSAGMAYGGTEMLGLTTAECKHPRKVMPLGAMLVIGRIVVCYLLPLFILGLVLSPSAFEIPEFARLQIVSPFVVAVDLAGLPALGHFINVVLLLSVFSMANASVFATSRAMTSICKKGMGPEQLSRLSKRGVPWNALLVVFGVSQLAWIGFAKDGERIFEWLLSVASASNYFTWSSICVCHIRMRHAMRKQGRSLNELTWRSPLGVYGSYFALFMNICCMIAQISSAILPAVLSVKLSNMERLWMGILGFIVVSALFCAHLTFVARRNKDKTWLERLWNPMKTLTLPELDARRDSEESTSVSDEKEHV